MHLCHFLWFANDYLSNLKSWCILSISSLCCLSFSLFACKHRFDYLLSDTNTSNASNSLYLLFIFLSYVWHSTMRWCCWCKAGIGSASGFLVPISESYHHMLYRLKYLWHTHGKIARKIPYNDGRHQCTYQEIDIKYHRSNEE